MPFLASCSFCHKKFKTGTSLSKHLAFSHPHVTQDTVTFTHEEGEAFQGPKPAEIPDEFRSDYLKWLSVLLERVNGSLVPDYPAKWCCIDCFQVPGQYFAHILHRLKSPSLNSVRDATHRRQPIFRKKTKRLSYKIHDEEQFREVLEEQDSLDYKAEALYQNDEEVADISQMGVEEALALAKQRAGKNAKKAARPTSSSSIEIGHGEGRCTREVEFIWWPTLYSTSDYGKLSIRFYLKKASI